MSLIMSSDFAMICRTHLDRLDLRVVVGGSTSDSIYLIIFGVKNEISILNLFEYVTRSRI